MVSTIGDGVSGDESPVEELLSACGPELREAVEELRALVADVAPDAVEEPDTTARLIGMTFRPGTYKGLFAAIAVHRQHVNLMFSDGVALQDHDDDALLEGTGKRARHVKVRDAEGARDPRLRDLVAAAAARTRDEL